MKLLIISDLQADSSLLDKMDSLFSQADAVLFAGNFASASDFESGSEALKRLSAKHEAIFAVLGSCDSEDFLEDLEAADVSVEKALVFHEGLAFSGAGGGLYEKGEGAFERSEEEILSDFDIINNSIEEIEDSSLWQQVILISHTPPRGQLCDKEKEDCHIGSQLFTDFILENQPLAVICGHTKEGRGIEKLGNTSIINPGSLQKGNYAWLELEKEAGLWKLTKADLQTL